MRNLFLVFLLFISVWFVDSQKDPIQLTSGVTVQGTLPALSSDVGQYDLDLYSIFIPENSTSLNLTFTNGNLEQCGKLHVFLRTFGLPCNTEQYDPTYVCANGWNVIVFGDEDDDDDDDDARRGNVHRLLLPSEARNQWDFAVNENTYLGIGRSSANTYNFACTYSLTTTVRTPCVIGQVGTYHEDFECANYVDVESLNQTYSLSFSSADTTSLRVFKVNIPPNTANLSITLNSTYDRNTIEGKSFSIPGDENNCEISEHTSVSGIYFFTTLYCYVPSAGDFYVAIDTTRNSYYNAQINFAINTCGNGTAGGRCEYPLALLPLETFTSDNTTNSTSTTPSPTTVLVDLPTPLGFYYWYFDIPENFTEIPLSIQVSPQQSNSHVRVRNNAPYYDDGSDDDENDDYSTINYNAPVTIHFNQYDWDVPKRVYLAFSCASRTVIDFCRFDVTTTFA